MELERERKKRDRSSSDSDFIDPTTKKTKKPQRSPKKQKQKVTAVQMNPVNAGPEAIVAVPLVGVPVVDNQLEETAVEEEPIVEAAVVQQKFGHPHPVGIWGGFEEIAHAAYVKPSGQYFKKPCSGCNLLLVISRAKKGTTLFNFNNPGHRCRRCADFIVCHQCHASAISSQTRSSRTKR